MPRDRVRYLSRILTIESDNKPSVEKTKVFHGREIVVKTVLRFISNSKSRIDTCLDHTRPSLGVEIQGVKISLIDARDRGIRTRFITGITKENVSHCKELIKLVSEVRHLGGIKGSFYIDENEVPCSSNISRERKT